MAVATQAGQSLKQRHLWSDQQKPMPHDAPSSSMVMILGGDEGVIERAKATWGGFFVPKRNLNPEPIERI
jgi:hypothetical protein